MKRTLTIVSCASLLALAACGGGGSSGTAAKPVQKRVQDTSKQASGPGGQSDTMKMQEGQAPSKP